MKTNKKRIIIFNFFILLILFSTCVLADISGQDIINKAEDNMDYGNNHSLAQMTIITTGGAKRILKMDVWGQGTDKSIMKYTQPSRINGVSFLFLENDIWSYFPRTGRVRHLASSSKNQKMMGSSFSYDDFSSDAFTDYSMNLLREEKIKSEKCYLVEGNAKNDNASYDRVMAWVTKGDFRLIKVNYFKNKQKVKVMTIERFLKVNGQLRPKKIVMEDLNDDNETIFEYLQIETGMKFNPNFFNKRSLKRISSK